jgi:serine/threonine-protein kinase
VPRKGDFVADKYRVESLIGLGGMGAVVAAVHKDLGHRVAIKLLLPDAARNRSAMARFLREARAAAAIQNEHVARILDIGALPSGAPYMVMELLAGTSLAHVLQERGRLPVSETVDYVLQACEAVAEAHAVGIVHRDIKPSNLFLARRPNGSLVVKVLDFGISKAEWLATDPEFAPDLTATSDLVGTPMYMSPEQVRSSKNVDWRTDIWALGAVLYELLTDHPPFWADNLPALSAAIASDEPVPPAEHRPDIPLGLQTLILRCLRKDPATRPQSVAELALAIAPFTTEVARARVEHIVTVSKIDPKAHPARSQEPAVVRVDPTRDPLLDTSTGWGTTQFRRRPRLWRLAGAALAVVAAGGGLWALAARSGNERSAASPAPSAAPSVAAVPGAAPSVATATSQEPGAQPSASAPAARPSASAASSAKPRAPAGRRADPLDDRF